MSRTFALKEYYYLTKPGIIRGNILTAAAGYLFASQGIYNWILGLYLVFGTSFIIASACVLNNIIDRDIDSRMARTKNRAIVTGAISIKSALIYAVMLGLLGFALLAQTNWRTIVIGIVGILFYVAVYGYYKRRSVHGTLIGGISGATSLVAGYISVTNRFDTTSLILFMIMMLWQMPHFYAIGVYRKSDYKNAGLPILPVVAGITKAKKHILMYIVLYVIAILLLPKYGSVGVSYTIVMSVLSIWWLYIATTGLSSKDSIRYGHKIFGVSLIALSTFSAMIALAHYLP